MSTNPAEENKDKDTKPEVAEKNEYEEFLHDHAYLKDEVEALGELFEAFVDTKEGAGEAAPMLSMSVVISEMVTLKMRKTIIYDTMKRCFSEDERNADHTKKQFVEMIAKKLPNKSAENNKAGQEALFKQIA